jgi:hypothetical protein
MKLALRIALVGALLFRIDGARLNRRLKHEMAERKRARTHKQEGNVSVASAAAQHPASPSCFLASGFGLQRGCQYAQAMEPVPNCNSASYDQACYDEASAEQVRGYLRDVRTSSDYSSLTRSVTEAEGGGFGVSVSASFSYLKRSEVSERSIAFFIGASGRSKTRTMQKPVSMKLTSAAKTVLRNDPKRFLSLYGLKYVHTVTYGGSFLGSFTLNSKETSDMKDIQAFASVSVNKGLFSAKASTEFQNTVSQKSGRVSIFASADWKGGSGIISNYATPESMGNMFNQWDRSWRSSPEPLTIVTRRWIDSAEVQEIVNAMSVEDKDLFYRDDISPIMQSEISEENAKIMMVEHSIKQALSWITTDNNQVMRSCLTNLNRDVLTKRLQIDGLDDVAVLLIQQQWLNRDYSWFASDSLRGRYLSCVSNAANVCNVHAVRCQTWQTLVRDDRVDWCLRNPSCRGSNDYPTSDIIRAITQIAQSQGKNHETLKDELMDTYPGWEWMTLKFNVPGRRRRRGKWAWAAKGLSYGIAEGGSRLVSMGTYCPTPPSCGSCPSEENCIANAFQNNDVTAGVNWAWDSCSGGRNRNIFASRGMATMDISKPAGHRCLFSGNRHGKMYAFNLLSGSQSGMGPFPNDTDGHVTFSSGQWEHQGTGRVPR